MNETDTMSTRTLSKNLAAAFTLAASMGGCSGEDETSVQRQTALQPEAGEADRTGAVALAISFGGLSLSSVRYRVENSAGNIVLSDAIEVESTGDALTLEFAAPAGTGYRITLSAEGGAGVTCTGSSSFDVVAGAATDMSVTLECEASSVVASPSGAKLWARFYAQWRASDGVRASSPQPNASLTGGLSR